LTSIKIKGLLAINIGGGGGGILGLKLGIITIVAAAASVPSSFSCL